MQKSRVVPRALLLMVSAGVLSCGGSDSSGPSGPTSISVTPSQLPIIGIGVSQQVTAVALGRRQQALPNVAITWESQNPAIATVSGGATATVTSVAPGSTTITARAEGNISATVAVTVTAELRSVSSSVNTVVLDFVANQTRQATASASADPGINVTYSWTSSDPSKVTVTASGSTATFTAVSDGQATVTLTGRSQFPGQVRTADIPVTVNGVIRSVVVVPSTGTLVIPQTLALGVTVDADPGVSKEVTWTSGSPSIATVSASGVVTGVAPGSAVITAASRVNSLISGSATIQVQSIQRRVTLDEHNVTLAPGSQRTLTATVSGEASFPRTVTWSSKSAAIATVNAGVVVAVSAGSTYVVAAATADASVRDSAFVRVALPVGPVAVTNGQIRKAPDMVGVGARWFDSPLDVAFAPAGGQPSAGQLLVIADCSIYGRTNTGFTKSASAFSSCPQLFQASGTTLFAFSINGVAYRWTNGLDFVVANQIALPSTFTATDIWMAPSGVMYAVGLGGNAETLYRLSGGTWSPVALPTSRTLLGVWGSSESDVIVVGDSGTVLRYNGSSWSQVSGGPTTTISDVWSPGDGNWYFATNLGAYGLLGGTFRQLHGFSIFRVRGSGPNDIVFNANVRWDGQRATLIGTSLVLGNFGFGFSSFAASANEIAVTSLNGIVAVQPRLGAARAIVLAINPKFTDVDVTSDAHAVAVGDWGQVARFNGTTWSSEVTPDYVHLGFVSSLGPTQTWATGSTGIFFSNGTGWTEVHRRAAGNFELWGIWANSASDVWAVGRNGLVVRFDGAAWRPIPSGTTTYLRAVWGTGPNNMFVGGDNGVILRWNGTSFQAMNSGTTNNVQRIRGLGPTTAYAYASGGLYLRYDGTSWAPLTASASPAVDWSLWVNGPNDIYSSSSCVNRFDATSWSTVECNLPGLLGFDGLSTGGAVGAGVSGRLWLGRNAQARGFNVVAGTATAPRVYSDQLGARVELTGLWDGALPRTSKELPGRNVTPTRR